MKKQHTHIERIATVIFTYNKKAINKSPYNIIHKNKDGSVSKYGISRNGHYYKDIINTYSNVDDLDKVFKKAQRLRDGRKNSVTLKVQAYTGKYNKKTQRVSKGIMGKPQTYSVVKKGRKIRGHNHTDNVFIVKTDVITFINQYKHDSEREMQRKEVTQKDKWKSKTKKKGKKDVKNNIRQRGTKEKRNKVEARKKGKKVKGKK